LNRLAYRTGTQVRTAHGASAHAALIHIQLVIKVSIARAGTAIMKGDVIIVHANAIGGVIVIAVEADISVPL